MLKQISLVNGKLTNLVSVYDRGLAYGDGFFETMLWGSSYKNGEKYFGVEFWLKHLKRIRKGCKFLKINIPSNFEILKQRDKILKESLNSGYTSGLLKLIITRGVGGRGYKFEDGMKPTIIFLSFSKTPDESSVLFVGVKACICENQLFYHEKLFGYKHLNRLDSVLARSEWDKKYFEGICADQKGNLIEGTMTNIFFVSKNKIITPPIINSGISGVMRNIILKNATKFFDKVVIKNVHRKHLHKFDQMFLANSVIKIVPVNKIDNTKFIIKDNTRALIDLFTKKSNERKSINLEII